MSAAVCALIYNFLLSNLTSESKVRFSVTYNVAFSVNDMIDATLRHFVSAESRKTIPLSTAATLVATGIRITLAGSLLLMNFSKMRCTSVKIRP